MGWKLTGAREMSAALTKQVRSIGIRAPTALTAEANAILRDSKDNYVPVGMGDLRDSGRVGSPESRLLILWSVPISYGTTPDTAPYALAVHEYPSRYDPPNWPSSGVTFHPSGRGPKYLELPLLAARGSLASRLAARLALG